MANGLGERPERDAVAVGEAAAAQDGRLALDGADELVDEPRLPDPRLADDGDEPAATVGGGAPERGAERLELGVAPDHRRVEAHDPLDALADADEPVRGDGLGLPLELERLDLLDVDVVADEPVGEVAEEDLLGAGAACSRRAATLTASPVTSRWPVDGSPATTSPVFTPVRTVRRTPQCRSSSSFSTACACCMPAAARTARSASSSCSLGRPNTAMIASPMNFSTTPPCFSSSALIASK